MLSLYRSTSSRMKYIYVPLLFLSVLFAGLSCQRAEKSYPSAMQRAISLLSARPDSALYYLSQLDSQMADEPEETRMYHALLTLRAEDKLYVRQTSDSLIKSIVIYYNKQGDATKRLEAYYMLGRIYRTIGNLPQSLQAFQQAAEISHKCDRPELSGRIYEQMSYLFAYQELYPEAIQAIKASHKIFQKHGDAKGVSISLRNIARIFDRYQQVDSMAYYYRRAYETALTTQDSIVTNLILNEYISAFIDHGVIDKGAALIHKLPQEIKDKNPIALYSQGMICLHAGQADSASMYFRKSLQQKASLYLQRDIYRQLSTLNEKQGEVAQALHYERTCAMLKDSIAAITQTEAVYKIHALYNYQKIKQEKDRLLLQNERQQKLLYLSLLTLLGIGILISWGIRRFKQYKQNVAQQKKELANLRVELEREKETEQKQEHELQKNQTKIEELELLIETARKERDEKTETCQQLQRQISQLEISNRHIRLNMDEKALARQEKELRKQEMRQSAIYLWFHEESHWNHIPESAPQWEELRNLIKDCFPQFIVRLHTLYPKISEMELRTCFLLKLEIPLKAFPKIMNKANASAISNLRTRLYKKLFNKEGTASELDEFIVDL